MSGRSELLTAIRQRSRVFRGIREYFDAAGFLEVDTPVLTPQPIPESAIELFAARRVSDIEPEGTLFLVPSPEVWMKRLLTRGIPSLYQMAHCFRNGEQMDRWHRLEFTMLEWYRIGADARENIFRMRDLVGVCCEALGVRDFAGDFRIMSMTEAFENFAGFSLEADLLAAGTSEVLSDDANRKELQAILRRRLIQENLPVPEADESPDDLFHRLFITLVEDRLPRDRPLLLKDWPALVPTLARRIPGTPWSDRWELYLNGVEVANCYTEETRKDALETYWAHENAKKSRAAVPFESAGDWPREIAASMPECSGAAVGLDRLMAVLRGDESLEGMDLFPIRDMMPR